MLTDLAKGYNTPVIVISELARDSYKSGQRLSMASFKESGSIEYEASWLGILAAVEETENGYNLKHDWETDHQSRRKHRSDRIQGKAGNWRNGQGAAQAGQGEDDGSRPD